VLSNTITTIRIPRPINAQERTPHQFMVFGVCTSTPEPIKFSTSLTEPTGGREMPEEGTSETPQNSPASLLEISEEEARDGGTTFFFVGLEEALRDDDALEDTGVEDELAGLLAAEDDTCGGGALLTGAEELCCPGVLTGAEAVSPGFV